MQNNMIIVGFSVLVNMSADKLNHNKTVFYNTGGIIPIQVFCF
jgi:hypothetical protein